MEILGKRTVSVEFRINENDIAYSRFLRFDVVLEDNYTTEENQYINVILDVTSSPFLLNGKLHSDTEIRNFETEFIQKAIASFYVIDFLGGATSVEDAFQLLRKLKLQFLEGVLGLSKWRTDEPKLRELSGIILDENFQPNKILGILLDEEKNDINIEMKNFANNLQPMK